MTVPFGILFKQEEATLTINLEREYDPIEQISFCIDSIGKRVPFVTLGFISLGATATGTATKTIADNGDDPDPEIPRPKP